MIAKNFGNRNQKLQSTNCNLSLSIFLSVRHFVCVWVCGCVCACCFIPQSIFCRHSIQTLLAAHPALVRYTQLWQTWHVYISCGGFTYSSRLAYRRKGCNVNANNTSLGSFFGVDLTYIHVFIAWGIPQQTLDISSVILKKMGGTDNRIWCLSLWNIRISTGLLVLCRFYYRDEKSAQIYNKSFEGTILPS